MSNWGIAACGCGEPLVSTLGFSKYEFVCVHDGRKFGFLDPVKPGLPETPDNLARLDANKADWQALSEGMLGDGVMLKACDTCRVQHTPHYGHATVAEIAAHDAAMARMYERWQA